MVQARAEEDLDTGNTERGLRRREMQEVKLTVPLSANGQTVLHCSGGDGG